MDIEITQKEKSCNKATLNKDNITRDYMTFFTILYTCCGMLYFYSLQYLQRFSTDDLFLYFTLLTSLCILISFFIIKPKKYKETILYSLFLFILYFPLFYISNGFTTIPIVLLSIIFAFIYFKLSNNSYKEVRRMDNKIYFMLTALLFIFCLLTLVAFVKLNIIVPLIISIAPIMLYFLILSNLESKYQIHEVAKQTRDIFSYIIIASISLASFLYIPFFSSCFSGGKNCYVISKQLLLFSTFIPALLISISLVCCIFEYNKTQEKNMCNKLSVLSKNIIKLIISSLFILYIFYSSTNFKEMIYFTHFADVLAPISFVVLLVLMRKYLANLSLKKSLIMVVTIPTIIIVLYFLSILIRSNFVDLRILF